MAPMPTVMREDIAAKKTSEREPSIVGLSKKLA